VFTVLHISRQKRKKDFCVKKRTKKGPFQQDQKGKKDQKKTISAGQKRKKDFCVKKGPKKDHFSSLVLKRTKSLIKDLYGSTELENIKTVSQWRGGR